MCYSNSSTSSNEHLAQTYQREIPPLMSEVPLFYASGFAFPSWRIVTSSSQIEPMEWGLLPNWFSGDNAQDFRQKTLNARLETVNEKKSFQGLVNRKRCIIPSNGFFEWQHNGKTKTPFFIYPHNTPIFSMAGLYDEWKSAAGKTLKTFSIITTEANMLMSEIHNIKRRMPLLLSPLELDLYLEADRPIASYEVLKEEFMKAHPVEKTILLSSNNNIPEVQQVYVNNIGIQSSLF